MDTPDWSRLVDLLPTVERPVADPDSAAVDFAEVAYDSQVVYNFDWPAWEPKGRLFFDNAASLAEAKLPTLRKLVTLHVRKDRFSEGHLAEMINAGHVSAILRRVEELVMQKG